MNTVMCRLHHGALLFLLLSCRGTGAGPNAGDSAVGSDVAPKDAGSTEPPSSETSSPDARAVAVAIHADQVQKTTLSWGLLHGVTRSKIGAANPTPLIRAVEPKVWGMTNNPNDVFGYVTADGQFPLVVGTKIVWNVHGSFMYSFPGRHSSSRICVGSAQCPTSDAVRFATFADLQAAWRAFLQQFIAKAPPYDWYDIFAEPDNQIFGITYPDNLVTLYLDAESAIRARYPQAKLVAPSYLSFSKLDDNRLVEFVKRLRQRGGNASAISWHELGAHPPGVVVEHAAAARVAACSGTSCPELHINEYESPAYTQWPGRQVAWLHYFQVADIQKASRACWKVQIQGGPEGDTCWSTFSGLIDDTYQATQPIYWVQERYARMTHGGTWLVVSPFVDVDLGANKLTGVAAVAADMGSATNEVRILVGNFGNMDVGPLDVVLTGYPYLSEGNVNVAVERIAGIGPRTISRTAHVPVPAVTTALPVQGRRFVIGVAAVLAGDAYSIVVTPR